MVCYFDLRLGRDLRGHHARGRVFCILSSWTIRARLMTRRCEGDGHAIRRQHYHSRGGGSIGFAVEGSAKER
ncbi:hypothetical protein NL676_007780 [Syzygium grande]|nr:hypothetical protein NL676_007780 [Syzygium grande]